MTVSNRTCLRKHPGNINMTLSAEGTKTFNTLFASNYSNTKRCWNRNATLINK